MYTPSTEEEIKQAEKEIMYQRIIKLLTIALIAVITLPVLLPLVWNVLRGVGL